MYCENVNGFSWKTAKVIHHFQSFLPREEERIGHASVFLKAYVHINCIRYMYKTCIYKNGGPRIESSSSLNLLKRSYESNPCILPVYLSKLKISTTLNAKFSCIFKMAWTKCIKCFECIELVKEFGSHTVLFLALSNVILISFYIFLTPTFSTY